MLKKIINLSFVLISVAGLSLPFLFADRAQRGISEQENRNLSEAASLFNEEGLNLSFPSEYETWFKDHLGFRSDLLNMDGSYHFHIFNELPASNDTKLGQQGDLVYASKDIIADFQHINTYSEDILNYIGQSYQLLSDYAAQSGAQFYYVQCTDKQTIYPEQFLQGVRQIGDRSKTDGIIEALDKTTVKHLYLKDAMLEAKQTTRPYGSWCDPTHWSPRGAFVGYQKLMEMLNLNGNDLKVLTEDDFNIEMTDMGQTMYGYHKEDLLEKFTLKDPKAVAVEDLSDMGQFAEDDRHIHFKNESCTNGLKIMIMGDSYFGSIREWLAESVSDVYFVWGDYGVYYPEAVDTIQPDIVIFEAAERVDRSYNVTECYKRFAQTTS